MGSRHTRLQLIPLALLLGSALLFVAAPAALALTTISESYQSTAQIAVGSIVSSVKDSQSSVEPSVTANVDNLLGVAINPDSSLLTVSTGTEQQVQVATSGTLPVMVSNLNGDIKRGDHITASPLKGLGMLANGNVRIVGIAQGDMTSKREQTIKDANGNDQKLPLARCQYW